jgi:hypothetical protein
MELAYTLIFFIFVYNWFSRYNFISLILFIWTFNSIKNVRNHIVKNKIENSPNPFLQVIKWSNDIATLTWNKVTSTKSNFWLVKWFGDKYNYLNSNFLELLEITKKESLIQFSSCFNYTLNAVLTAPPQPLQISAKSASLTDKEMIGLNKEYEKKNSLFVPFSLLMGGLNKKSKNNIMTNAEQVIKTHEEINKINTIIKDLDTQINLNSRIDLYDSDEDKESVSNYNLKKIE